MCQLTISDKRGNILEAIGTRGGCIPQADSIKPSLLLASRWRGHKTRMRCYRQQPEWSEIKQQQQKVILA